MADNKTSGDGITEELKAKCDADNQFGRFDRVFRQVVSVPKAAIDKEDAKQKRLKAKKKKNARS
jgi:hypothetical protein